MSYERTVKIYNWTVPDMEHQTWVQAKTHLNGHGITLHWLYAEGEFAETALGRLPPPMTSTLYWLFNSDPTHTVNMATYATESAELTSLRTICTQSQCTLRSRPYRMGSMPPSKPVISWLTETYHAVITLLLWIESLQNLTQRHVDPFLERLRPITY